MKLTAKLANFRFGVFVKGPYKQKKNNINSGFARKMMKGFSYLKY